MKDYQKAMDLLVERTVVLVDVDAFKGPDADAIMRPLVEWIADTALHGERMTVRGERRGEDYSTYAVPTGEHYDLTKYTLVSDFLGEPWRTYATYCPGNGFAVESLGQAFSEEVWYAVIEWAQTILTDLPEIDPGEIAKDFLDSDDGAWLLYYLDKYLRELPFRELVQSA